MDLLAFARYYAGPSNPHFLKMVQDHDREARPRFDHFLCHSFQFAINVFGDVYLGNGLHVLQNCGQTALAPLLLLAELNVPYGFIIVHD